VSKDKITNVKNADPSKFMGYTTVANAKDAFTKWTITALGQIIVLGISTLKVLSYF
jgi:hypothetical protein